MRRWTITFATARRRRPPEPPRPADINSLGRHLLGEHEPHSDPIKPRSVRLRLDDEGEALKADLRWLSDAVDPVRDPASAVGSVIRCGQHVLTAVEVQDQGTTTWPNLVEEHVDDPYLEVDVRALSPIVLPSVAGAAPGTLDAVDLARSLLDRWDGYARWRPGRRLDDAPGQIPADVRAELLAGFVIVRVSAPTMVAQQVKYDQGRAIERPALQADLRLRWHPCTEAAAVWASALCDLMVWDGIGQQTQAGLGQVAVTPALWAHDLD